MRRPFIAGNWKMNGAGEAAVQLARDVAEQAAAASGGNVDVAICPPFTSIQAVATALKGLPVMVGAQDVFWRDSGAFTAQISGPMLREAGCSCVIVGHSECRGRFGKAEDDINDETICHFGHNDATVSLKLQAALRHELLPIVCVGETLPEREAGQTDTVVETQVRALLKGLSAEALSPLTVAYEPVWAIGTGKTCDSIEANRVCGVIREVVGRLVGDVASRIRIQYGGSVTADNAAELLSKSDIDGALVGGQSLKAEAFARIVAAAAASAR